MTLFSSLYGLCFFVVLPELLDLNDQDKKDLVLFMKALTDTSAIKNVPKRLPQLGEKYAALNKRKIGGEYRIKTPASELAGSTKKYSL